MPICSGSRSIWIKRLGTGIRRQSVMTSVNRQPTASMASACGKTCRRPDRAGMAERERVALVEQALAVERGDDRRAEPPGQGLDRRRPRPTRARRRRPG